jgi:hypothetical protein
MINVYRDKTSQRLNRVEVSQMGQVAIRSEYDNLIARQIRAEKYFNSPNIVESDKLIHQATWDKLKSEIIALKIIMDKVVLI